MCKIILHYRCIIIKLILKIPGEKKGTIGVMLKHFNQKKRDLFLFYFMQDLVVLR